MCIRDRYNTVSIGHIVGVLDIYWTLKIVYYKLLQYYTVITDEEIVESLSERNENETDSDEDGDNATNTKPSTAAKAFDGLETVLKWAKTEDKIDCIQLMNLKRLQSLAARKRGIGLKQTEH